MTVIKKKREGGEREGRARSNWAGRRALEGEGEGEERKREASERRVCTANPMEWMLPPTSNRKRVREPVNTPIDQLIRASRARVQEQIDQAPQLRQRIESMDAKLAMLPDGRRFIRMRRDLAADRERLRARVAYLEDGDAMRDFERSVADFVRVYNSSEGSKKRTNAASVLPGERVSTFRVETTSSTQLEVINEYLTAVDNVVPRIQLTRQDTCPRCDGGRSMRLVPAKALVACTHCGYCASYLDATTSSVSFGDDIEFANFSYKRINHFSEWLSNIQGTETYEVPDDVLRAVCGELFRQRVAEADVTYKKVREVLKVLKLRKQYEHTTQITCRITNRPLPRLSTRTQEMCRLMFRACQEPFSRHAGMVCQGRKNFMSYSYILYQFLFILGESQEILEAFTLLKGRDKRQRMDEVFALIAADLDWDFCPTS